MKKTTVYEIAIRIIGIYALTLVVYQIAAVVTSVMSLGISGKVTDDSGNGGILGLLIAVGSFVLVTIVPWFLLFKTQIILSWIFKPGDEDETLSIIVEPKVIYEMAILIAGILLVIWALPDFFLKFINYISVRIAHVANDVSYLEVYVVKIIVGCFAIAYANPIAAFFARRTKNVPRD